MAKEQPQTEFKREAKERIPVWMYPSTLAMMDGAIQQANYKSRSEFLEEAAKYLRRICFRRKCDPVSAANVGVRVQRHGAYQREPYQSSAVQAGG